MTSRLIDYHLHLDPVTNEWRSTPAPGVWDIAPPTPEQDFAERMAHYEKMREKVRELRGYYNDAMRYRKLREQPTGVFGDRIDGAQVWRSGTALDELADKLPDPSPSQNSSES